ncbi:gap junction delta-4 protein-like protein [Lates japonicus]|uniref:Gap junction delta-4 protein-like protein n=1 Tax=Lates japonicus TaxID=270547 RepID=A0AAD3NJ51_LATJO|nr:gap junction delta-4 protein-like protein [Lates japonicus]
MLNFMLGVASLSILLSLVDMMSSLNAMVRWRRKREMLMEEMSKGEQSMNGGSTLKTSVSVNEKSQDTEDAKVDMSRSPTLMSTPMPTHFVLHSHLRPPLSPRPDRGPPLNPRIPTPMGAKKLGHYTPVITNSCQQSDSSESQDKRAWV